MDTQDIVKAYVAQPAEHGRLIQKRGDRGQDEVGKHEAGLCAW